MKEENTKSISKRGRNGNMPVITEISEAESTQDIPTVEVVAVVVQDKRQQYPSQ